MQKNPMADSWNLDPTKQTNTDMKANWLNLDNVHLPHYLSSYWGRKRKGRKEVRNSRKDKGEGWADVGNNYWGDLRQGWRADESIKRRKHRRGSKQKAVGLLDWSRVKWQRNRQRSSEWMQNRNYGWERAAGGVGVEGNGGVWQLPDLSLYLAARIRLPVRDRLIDRMRSVQASNADEPPSIF